MEEGKGLGINRLAFCLTFDYLTVEKTLWN
jgi:hypothetical protein